MQKTIYLIILCVGAMLAGLVEWNAKVSLNRELISYRVESNDESHRIADDIWQTFDTTYRAVRTIARLPAIRTIDWSNHGQEMDRNGALLDENTRLTVQEIYNALAIDVAISELYIVPRDLDPDGLDPTHLSPREPAITFDEFIVGRTNSSPDLKTTHLNNIALEEVEIFEYRLMRKQLDWFETNYPRSDRIIALDYPALTGPPVITCDNSRIDPYNPVDDRRTGIVISVPIFNDNDSFKGCVTAVILNDVLGDLLPSGNYALFNENNQCLISGLDQGQWAKSFARYRSTTEDYSLLYSQIVPIPSADRGGNWEMWSGFPDANYWSRNGVQATLQARTIGFVAVLILSLGALSGTTLVIKAYKRIEKTNVNLEETISSRTSDLIASRDSAVVALEREKTAMSEKNKTLAILEKMASTDKLTGLPNRALFLDRLQQIMKHSRRDNGKFAVLFFDFDRFKIVNDSLGHDVGDGLLCNMAKIFRRELRDNDTAARFGGDEFVVLLCDLEDWSDARVKAERLLEAFAEPHLIDGHMIVSTASIGLVTSQISYQNPSDMIRDADAAMYQAKENGKNQVVEFDKAMHANALDRLTIESDLRIALTNQEFDLVYQPIMDLTTGKMKGLEALIRWNHPTRGLVSPDQFIYIAEDTGLICEIGRWVLWTAAAQLAQWNDLFDSPQKLSMNVNVSKRQILEPAFLDDILACQRTFEFYDNELQLEITESVIVDSRSNIIPLLDEIRRHKISIVMDDFGTGVSSLSALHAYPIDVLKIDQSFIYTLSGDRSLLAVVSSITNLAENLGIRTVAEGIESSDVVVALQSIGSTWGQGYFFAKPLSVTDARAFIELDHQQIEDAA
jgi:diguanylate cyclase (GGDEF)-like protein